MIELRPAAWNEGAAGLLAHAESAASLADLRGQCELDIARLFEVRDAAGELLAAYVLRVDHGIEGDEGVILSAAGRAGFDLTEHCLPAIERQFSGVVAIRVHTARPGLARKLARQGYAAAEIVLKKRVAHG